MYISKEGLKLLKQFEGCKLVAYRDVGGVLTIGYGHTRGVYPNQVVTLEVAEKMLVDDVWFFEHAVKDLVTVSLSQPQFDALVSFSYNLGAQALEDSTLLRKLNAGDYLGAADELLRWNRAGGKVVNGLVRRREAERALFLTGCI